MLRQNRSKPFVQVFLALVLSLCSLSVVSESVKSITFSKGVKSITFLQKSGVNTDNYEIMERWTSWSHVKEVSPLHLETASEDGGQTINITYLKTVYYYDLKAFTQQFEVRSRQHPDISATIKWVKFAGLSPIVEKVEDPLGLATIDDSDPNNIKISISYDGHSE